MEIQNQVNEICGGLLRVSDIVITMLPEVKTALNIMGDYQDETIKTYISEVVSWLMDAGVKESNITPGIVARGVTDLWNYGAGEGKLSSYFMQRASQLAYKS